MRMMESTESKPTESTSASGEVLPPPAEPAVVADPSVESSGDGGEVGATGEDVAAEAVLAAAAAEEVHLLWNGRSEALRMKFLLVCDVWHPKISREFA